MVREVHAGLPEAAGEPPKLVIGWTCIDLAAGEPQPVSITVPRDWLTIHDEGTSAWKLVPGNCNVLAGGSSQDLPLHQQVALQ